MRVRMPYARVGGRRCSMQHACGRAHTHTHAVDLGGRTRLLTMPMQWRAVAIPVIRRRSSASAGPYQSATSA